MPRLTPSLLLLAAALASPPLLAADALPPRSQWQASASSRQVAALAPQHAIDGDETTRWGGAFSPGHWFQLDLGRPAEIGGVRLHWDSGFAVGYRIQASRDGKTWDDVYTSTDSRGATDYLFFPARQARYLRLASPERTADWGVSVLEFEPLAAATAAARLVGLPNDAARVWQGGAQPAGDAGFARRRRRGRDRAAARRCHRRPRSVVGRPAPRRTPAGARGQRHLAHRRRRPGQCWRNVFPRRAGGVQAHRPAPARRPRWRGATHPSAAPARPRAGAEPDQALRGSRQPRTRRAVPGATASTADLLDRGGRSGRTAEIDLR